MAESQSKIDAAAEKAFAEASEKKAAAAAVTAKPAETAAPAAKAPVAKADEAAKPAAAPAAKAEAAKKPAAKKAAKKPAARKAATKPVRKPAAKKAPAKKPVAAKAAARTAAKTGRKAAALTTPIIQLKDKIMATTKTTDFTKTAQNAAAELQTRAKAAYDKGTELTAEVTAFHKGNFDALVESGKVLAAGVQDFGRTAVEDAKTAAETVTADFRKMAAVKSPTELFQLQGEIARRNLDTLVARTSKNTEAMMKLAGDVFAPLSSRASVAMERIRKAA